MFADRVESYIRPGNLHDRAKRPAMAAQIAEFGGVKYVPGSVVEKTEIEVEYGKQPRPARQLMREVISRLADIKTVCCTRPRHQNMRFMGAGEAEAYKEHTDRHMAHDIGLAALRAGLLEIRPDKLEDEEKELRAMQAAKRGVGDVLHPSFHDHILMERGELVVMSSKAYHELIATVRMLSDALDA